MGESGFFYSVSEYYPVLGSFAHCQVCISSWYISVCSFFSALFVPLWKATAMI